MYYLWEQESKRFAEYIQNLREISYLDINAMAGNALIEEKYLVMDDTENHIPVPELTEEGLKIFVELADKYSFQEMSRTGWRELLHRNTTVSPFSRKKKKSIPL